MSETTPLLSVKDLAISFRQGGKITPAVHGISFSLEAGRTLALVGESGSGKSITSLSIFRLLDKAAALYPSG